MYLLDICEVIHVENKTGSEHGSHLPTAPLVIPRSVDGYDDNGQPGKLMNCGLCYPIEWLMSSIAIGQASGTYAENKGERESNGQQGNVVGQFELSSW